MTVQHDEEWVQIATLDEQDHIYFTTQYLEILGSLGWEAKAFAAHLLGLWYDPFEHVLDYISGYAKYTNDQPPGDFGNYGLEAPQEVVEYWAEAWSQNSQIHEPTHEAGLGMPLGVEWYRDVLRAKLVSIRLPKRLLLAYKEQSIAKRKRLGIPLED